MHYFMRCVNNSRCFFRSLSTFNRINDNAYLLAIPLELRSTHNFLPSNNFLIYSHFNCQETITEKEEEPKKIIDASKDRSKVIPVEVSIRYLQSSAYQTTYGSDPVWKLYRRNHKGQFPPQKTRKRCIRKNLISTGNPCPICRDEYLVLDPKNTSLLKQFISPHTGAVLSYELTGLCQRRHIELIVAIMQAKEMGLLTFDLPFQKYDYSEYLM